jgi:small subunit ribosomal protein S1
VSNLCDFGAFVDLGGIDGLVHISELSWGRVNHPSEVLSMKQEVDVYVLDVDKQNERIALSIKRLKANPWKTVEKEFNVGQTVPATVTNIVDFGAFAKIKRGVEGLVHISEMAEFEVQHPSDIVDVGDRVNVCILDIDCERHRLSLSMRQAGP